MCLGIPGRIEAITQPEARLALVDVLGVRREVNIAFIVGEGETLADCVGAWVLVHVGFAMSRVDEHEARLTLQLLQELGQAQAEIEAFETRASVRAERRAAPKPARIPSGDRPVYSPDEGQS